MYNKSKKNVINLLVWFKYPIFAHNLSSVVLTPEQVREVDDTERMRGIEDGTESDSAHLGHVSNFSRQLVFRSFFGLFEGYTL